MSGVTLTKRRSTADVLAEARSLAARINEGATAAGVLDARANCPVSNDPKPVHLIDTIRAEADEQTGEVTMVAGDPEQGVDYAWEVEFGWYTADGSHVPGRFFFAQGEETGRQEAQRLAEVLKPKG